MEIAVDTGQILDIESFVANHDANELSAPLDTKFLFRDDEINGSLEALSRNNVLVIYGPAGVGKTRLALYICDKFIEKTDYQLLCIKSNYQEIFEDLQNAFEDEGNYLVLIDDANELSGLHLVLDYLKKQNEKFHIKIVITVRDYARAHILNIFKEVLLPETLKLTIFKDDEIRKLMEQNYNITNPVYTERIISIAEGNARLAMLAGKVAAETQSLDSIRDASQLYDFYYSKQIVTILSRNRSLIISAGIIAFVQKIHLSYLDRIESILIKSGLTKDQFSEDMRYLHSIELVDICNDIAVKVSDQSFSNFLIKYVFVDCKHISLHCMIETCFAINQQRTIEACNILLNVFSDEQVHEYLLHEINIVWDGLIANPEQFRPFFKSFHMIKPTETLLIIQKQIDEETPYIYDIFQIDFKENGGQIDDDILDVLGSFSNHIQLPEAIELIMLYYKKRPDMFMQFYLVFVNRFGIDNNSEKYNYYTQSIVIEHLIEHIKSNPSRENILLFIRISSYYLKLFYSPAAGGRKNTIILYQIPLRFSDKVIEYRRIILNQLKSIYEEGLFVTEIEEILSNYGRGYGDKIDYNIITAEFDLILNFFEVFSSDNLYHCIIANHVGKTVKESGNAISDNLSVFLNSKKFILYQALCKRYVDEDVEYEQQEKMRFDSITKLASNYSIEDVNFLLQVCKESVGLSSNNYLISSGLKIVFTELIKNPSVFVPAVKLYLLYDTPYELRADLIIKMLFELLPYTDVEELILQYDYSQKNTWNWEFFMMLPKEAITEEYKNKLYEFLSIPQSTLKSSPYRSLDNLDNYLHVDKSVWITASRIILENYEKSPLLFYLYFDLHFNSYHIAVKDVISKYQDDLPLLYEIYLKCISYNEQTDCDGDFLSTNTSKDFMSDYLDQMLSQNYHKSQAYIRRLNKLWQHTNFIGVIDYIVLYLSDKLADKPWELGGILKELLLHEGDDTDTARNQDEWIKHIISFYNRDEKLMKCVFDGISELSAERRKVAVTHFVALNPDPEVFMRLPLEASSWGGMGSLIPYMEQRITYLSSLLPSFSGMKYLRHKKRIEDDIQCWRKQIRSEEINELLEF